MKRALAIALFVCVLPLSAPRAQEFVFDGFIDARLVRTGEERGWTKGGLGKFRYEGGGDVEPHFGELSATGTLRFTPDLSIYTHLRYEPSQLHPIDIIEGYVRYRPVSTMPFRGSVKLGAFFPPISLENDGIGWTSIWTLTPSAINSWVGEELRTIGGEVLLEWRDQAYQIELTGALFAASDPAGVMVADRGWIFTDRPTGLLDKLREPDPIAGRRRPVPLYSEPFLEIDGRVGWYVGLTGRSPEYGRLSLLYYNNEADASERSSQFAWRTDFWSLGAQTQIGDLVLIGQAMTGSTTIKPTAVANRTEFESVFLLAGWDFGQWRLAGRVDQFGTNTFRSPTGSSQLKEHGWAQTLALTWRPWDRLRITGEIIHVESRRAQRTQLGEPPVSDEIQVQLGARLFF